MNYQKILFFFLFITFGFAALQVPLVHFAGSKATFTLFDAFGPIAGAFLGTLPGIVAVLIMQITNFVLHGSKVLDIGTIIRFLPMLFATMYFSKPSKLNWIVPGLAIVIFNLNPIGRSVWFYSLFWLVPIGCYFWQEKSILLRSLGATFTAHAMGGAIWIWAFHLPKAVWLGLIPVVIMERLGFTISMAALYLCVRSIINQNYNRHAIHQN